MTVTFKGGLLPQEPARPRLRISDHFKDLRTGGNPQVLDWLSAVANYPMYLNDSIGDCTIAMTGHQIEAWTKYGQGTTQEITNAQVLTAYEAVSGYVPGNPSTDNGAVLQDVLNYWRNTGIGGHKIVAFAQVDVSNLIEVHSAIHYFGSISVGVNFPTQAMNQFNAHQPWSVVPGDTIEGGHAIHVGAYNNPANELTCITWGAEQIITLPWWRKYCVAPETKILTADLRWVEANTLLKGDKLLAFDEEGRYVKDVKKRGRRFKAAYVESAKIVKQPCYELEFEDGTKIRCSSDHRWLVGGNQSAKWVTTEHLSLISGRESRIIKPVDVWEVQNTRDSGYLAAAFDGEGSLDQRDLSDQPKGIFSTKLVMAQKGNAMLSQVLSSLKEEGFEASCHLRKNESIYNVQILGGRHEMLRFLGSIRPHRLLYKFDPDKLGLIKNNRTVRIVSKTYIGEQDVVALATDAKTYFAEGFASHNCTEAWVSITQDWINANSHLDPLRQGLTTLSQEFTQLTGQPGFVGGRT